jgi:hypothetical protein
MAIAVLYVCKRSWIKTISSLSFTFLLWQATKFLSHPILIDNDCLPDCLPDVDTLRSHDLDMDTVEIDVDLAIVPRMDMDDDEDCNSDDTDQAIARMKTRTAKLRQASLQCNAKRSRGIHVSPLGHDADSLQVSYTLAPRAVI